MTEPLERHRIQKGKIDYETGEIDITWVPSDPVSELGDLVRGSRLEVAPPATREAPPFKVVNQIHDEVTVEINVGDDAVDQLAEVVLPEEERKRRRAVRNLRRLFHAEAQLGISSRGIKPR